MNLAKHLATLDHARLADLIGDATIVELIDELCKSQNVYSERGNIILDSIGGPEQIFDNQKLLQKLLITFNSNTRDEIQTCLGVSDINKFSLRQEIKNKLYEYFEFEPPVVTIQEKGARVTGVNVGYSLFKHQHNAMLKSLGFLDSEKPAVMLHMPTGSGKTRTSMHMVCHLLNRKPETIIVWLVSGTELCEQAAAEFKIAWGYLGIRPLPLICLWGSRVGIDKEGLQNHPYAQNIIQSFEKDIWPENLKDAMIVASLDTMTEVVHKWNPLEMVNRTKKIALIVFDEAHRSVANTYKNTLEMLRNQEAPLLGLSATPGRHLYGNAGDYELGDLYNNQKVLLEIDGFKSPVEGLIEQGYLSRLEKEKLEIVNEKEDPVKIKRIRDELANSLDISEGTLKYFGLNATRNLQIINRVEKLISNEDHKRIIVFAPSVASSNLLANLLKTRLENITSTSITNETKQNIREKVLTEYKKDNEKVAVLFNYGVLTTGFDAPATSVVIIARPTKSIVLLSQMAGRALRGPRVGGSEKAKLITVVDTQIPELVDTVSQFHAFDDAWTIGEN